MVFVTHVAPMAEKYFSVIHEMGIVSFKAAVRLQFEDLFEGIDLAGKRMLDIGGGSGVYSFCAACMGAREVVCLEPEAEGSPPGVMRVFEKIRGQFPDAPVTLDTRIIQKYPPGEAFDIVLMHASVNHLDEDACIRLLSDKTAWERYKELLTHIGSLVPSGGKLIVVDCSRHNIFPALGLKNPLEPDIEWHKHHKPEVWARLLGEVGFRHPKITWQPLYRFGKPGKLLLGNRVAAYFLKSIFRLEMEKA